MWLHLGIMRYLATVKESVCTDWKLTQNSNTSRILGISGSTRCWIVWLQCSLGSGHTHTHKRAQLMRFYQECHHTAPSSLPEAASDCRLLFVVDVSVSPRLQSFLLLRKRFNYGQQRLEPFPTTILQHWSIKLVYLWIIWWECLILKVGVWVTGLNSIKKIQLYLRLGQNL